MPSPAKMTISPAARCSRTSSCLRAGVTPACTPSSPSDRATAKAVVSRSPVTITTRNPSRCNPTIASGVVALIGSSSTSMPAARPSMTTLTSVAVGCGWSALSPRRSGAVRAIRPTLTIFPWTRALTPIPGSARKPSAAGSWSPRACAAAMIARASGCSLELSAAAANLRRSSAARWSDLSSSRSGDGDSALGSTRSTAGTIATTRGLPSVRVPVLSMSKVVAWASRSSASAFFTRIPAWAPRPMPVTSDTGVARPRAHGQAMISTATALTNAKITRGSGPSQNQSPKVTTAMPATAGTNQAATRSASRWIGASLSCASSTRRTICASNVSRPTRSARMTKLPVVLRVPPDTGSPSPLGTGSASPVSIASSTLLAPSVNRPSTGTFSPGRTRSRSPGTTASRGTSSSWPSRIRWAVFGARSINARIAASVRACVRCSRIWPISTMAVINAVASK